jgi:hypothetical protein
MPINTGDERGPFLKLMADVEHDDPDQTPTCRLPALCPEAFEVSTMTPAQVQAALAAEFGERIAA